jgi:hypothetical protein
MKKIISLLTATCIALTMSAMPVFGDDITSDGSVTGNISGEIVGENGGNISGEIVSGNTGNISGEIVGENTGNISGEIVTGNGGNISGEIVGENTGNISGEIVDGNFAAGDGDFIPTQSGTEYDENGNVLRETFYHDEYTWYVTEYIYHSNGEVRSVRYYDSEDFEYVSYFDANGNPVAQDVGDNGGGGTSSYFPEYNEAGQITKETYDFGDGTSLTYVYEYNSLGQNIKRTDIADNHGEIITEETFYQYDANYNLIYEKNVSGETWTLLESVYSDDGTLLVEHSTDSEGNSETFNNSDGTYEEPSYEILSEDGKFGYDLYGTTAEITYIAFEREDYFTEKNTITKEFENGEVYNFNEYVWNKKTAEIEIPETVDGYEVTGIYLRDISYDFITKLSLPKTISYISIAEQLFPNLIYAEVAEGNERYISSAGVIYPIGMVNITLLPPAYSGTLVLPATYVGSGGEAYNFDDYGNIVAFEISESASGVVPEYYTYDGLLYQYEREDYDYDLGEYVVYEDVLFACPAGKTGTVTVKDGTTVIGERAFQFSKASSVILPNTVEQILYDAFYYAEAGVIVLPDSLTYIEDFESDELDDFMGYQMMYATAGSYADEYAKALVASNNEQIKIVENFINATPDAFEHLFPDEYSQKLYDDVLKGYVAKVVDAENVKDGDLDGDGNLGIVDIVTLSKYVIGKATLAPGMVLAADMSGDGVVNSVDLAILRSRVVTG